MNENRLPKLIYNSEIGSADNENTWIDYTKNLLKDLNLNHYWVRQRINKSESQWNKIIFDRIQKREQTNWLERAHSKPKLRTYIKYKTTLTEEDYLRNDDPIGRRMMARIRSGTNNLRIETDRYKNPKQLP